MNTHPAPPIKIMVVDDEQGLRDMLSFSLSGRGFDVTTAQDGEEAIRLLKESKYVLAICDIKMPRKDGLATLTEMKALAPDMEVVMATGFGTVELAIQAMKLGAHDFIQKPFNLDELFAVLDKALERSELKTLAAAYEASKVIFSTVNLHVLLPVIARLAKQTMGANDVSVLLREETGKFSLAATEGAHPSLQCSDAMPLGRRVALQVSEQREPVVIVGPLEDDGRFGAVRGSRTIRSSIVYPLSVGGECVGVLNINRTTNPKPYTALDLRNVTVLCSQIAQEVFNARLYERLEVKVKELKEAYETLEKTQGHLLQAEKMASLGELSAGVAHELNNPLTGIIGFAQLLLQESTLSPQQREDIESIHKQSQRCRQIIQNLLHFSRRKEPQKEPLRLNALMDETLQLIRYDLSTSGIQIVSDVPPHLPGVLGDANQLQQVFLNIITNARQALDGKETGTITIRGKAQGEKVFVSFEDNGCGLSSEDLKKVFNPFFTTKPVGKGTGLGLSISYGIIQNHGGEIRVESRRGVGCVFTIELPALSAVPEQA